MGVGGEVRDGALEDDVLLSSLVSENHNETRPNNTETIVREPENHHETRPNNTLTLTFHHLLDLVIHFTSQLLRSLDENFVTSSHLTLGMTPCMDSWLENGCE